MVNGLDYFKQVYDVVPEWVQKMHDYNPKVLNCYTALRSEIMQGGRLSRKVKDTIIASANAARGYERSMIFHTKGAMDFGSTIEELVEYFLVSYIYAGIPALERATKALHYALSLQNKQVEIPQQLLDAAGYIQLFNNWLETPSAYLQQVLNALGTEQEQQQLLNGGTVTTQHKHLAMIANFTTELQGQGAARWIDKARAVKVTDEELSEIGFICVLTAGIPTWFEISDSLQAKGEKKRDE